MKNKISIIFTATYKDTRFLIGIKTIYVETVHVTRITLSHIIGV
jgi:hypothetical protein